MVFARERPVLEGQVRFVEGMAAFHLGDDSRADTALDRAWRVAPGSAFAHQWKAALEGLRGHEQPAQPHLSAFCARHSWLKSSAEPSAKELDGRARLALDVV